MKFPVRQSLAVCLVGAMAMAGCASQRTSAVASAPMNGQQGKIASIDNMSAADQSSAMSSSGGGAMGTVGSSALPVMAVDFADGTQGRYVITKSAGPLRVGQVVSVVPNGENFLIVSPQ